MRIHKLTIRIGSVLAATFAACMTIAAAPVQAEEAVAHSPLGDGDADFRDMFNDWSQRDDAGNNSAPAAHVAIPSRMPLDSAKLTSDFGMRVHPILGGRRQHKGIDLASPIGTPIYATADGVVGKAEWFGGYGNYVQLEHGGSLETRYGHMSQIAVTQGEHVKKGDLLGYVGTTGRSTGPHLHYEVRVGGLAVNPTTYMVEITAKQAFALARGEGGKGGPE